MSAKVKKVCTTCGSDDIAADASAVWNVEEQKWELGTVFDNTDCKSCNGECTVDDVEII